MKNCLIILVTVDSRPGRVNFLRWTGSWLKQTLTNLFFDIEKISSIKIKNNFEDSIYYRFDLREPFIYPIEELFPLLKQKEGIKEVVFFDAEGQLIDDAANPSNVLKNYKIIAERKAKNVEIFKKREAAKAEKAERLKIFLAKREAEDKARSEARKGKRLGKLKRKVWEDTIKVLTNSTENPPC